VLEGALFSAAGWDPEGKHRLLQVSAPLDTGTPAAEESK
jgi:hypothetical protein